MSFLRGAAHNTPQAREGAFRDAEKRLVRPGPQDTLMLSLIPGEIKTIPSLFQPREFSFGLREVDNEHVKRLRSAAKYNDGELDPVLVVRLGEDWVCGDGDQRVAECGDDSGA